MNQLYKYGTFQRSTIYGIVTKVGQFNTIGQDKTPHIEFTVKTVEYYKPKNDPTVLKEFVKWHQCRAFGRMAEMVDSFAIEPGDLVRVEGPFDYGRAADISSAINQFVTIKVSLFNILLKNAEEKVTDNIYNQNDDSEVVNSDFDFVPLPEDTTDVQ